MGRKEAALNIEKHSVDFIDAVTIFERSLDELPKREHDYGEERFAVLGQTADGQVLFVVYTWRGERCRLISARKAGRNERERFYKSIAEKPA